jgi:putative serine/threonine protein kinase
MQPPTIIPIEKLNEEPFAEVVCYPRTTPKEIENRITQLHDLGVLALEFSGNSAAFKFPVLGKGYVGVVVIAHINGERLAIKMRRSDADRKSLEPEARLLAKANSVKVGPKFVAATKDFLLMQLIEGNIFPSWVEEQCDKDILRNVLHDILEQCWRLDEAGLDHGELSKAPKHLLIDRSNKAFIVDFETASSTRKVSNVTSICQFLFQSNSDSAKQITEVLGMRDKDKLVLALKRYKKERNPNNFEVLLKLCLS